MPDAPFRTMREAIRGLHGCDSAFVESFPVQETFRGRVVWDGDVFVFDLTGHPTATRAYAWWADAPPAGRRRLVAVVRAGPVDSPAAAVRAAVRADQRAAMRPWRTAGVVLMAIGAAIAAFAWREGRRAGGLDGDALAILLIAMGATPFVLAGAILYGIGLRRSPPA